MLLLNITSDRTVVPLKMMYPKGHNIACAKDTSESNHEENQKLYRQGKTKRIQHHQTSFTTNAKGTSLGRGGKSGHN